MSNTLVDKALATLTYVNTLDAKSLTAVAFVLAAELTSSPELDKALQEVVEKWLQETKGVVPFEIEATCETVVKQVLASKGDDTVKATSVGCLSYFASLFCRYVSADVPKGAKDAVYAVDAVDAVDAV